MKIFSAFSAFALLLGSGISSAHAQIVMHLDSQATWLGFMNVFELPENGGAYVFGEPWGTADLTATFSGPNLTLGPNTIGDPNPFWYVGGGGPGAQGNKNMDASMYVEDVGGALAGQTVTFTANVLSNTLVSPYTSVAFIKDFAPDYSSFNVVTAPLVDGVFSISMDTINDPARHVQYGFTTVGPNVWITDAGPIGNVLIAPVPEPSSLGVLAGGLVTLLGCQRVRSRRPGDICS